MILDFWNGPVMDYIDNQESVVVLRSRRQYKPGREVSVRIAVPGNRPAPTRVVVKSCRPLETGGYAVSAFLPTGAQIEDVETNVDTATDAALRSSPRLECHICVLSKDLPGYRAVTVDYSCGGVQLEVPGEVEPGASVLVRLEFDVNTLPALECKARVAWCSAYDRKNYRVGLQFVDLDAKAREVLDRFEQILLGRDDTPILHRLLFGDEGQPALENAVAEQAPAKITVRQPVQPITGSIHEGKLTAFARDHAGVTVTIERPSGEKAFYRFPGHRGLSDFMGVGSAEHEIGDLVEKTSAGGCNRYQFVGAFRKVVLEIVAPSYTRS